MKQFFSIPIFFFLCFSSISFTSHSADLLDDFVTGGTTTTGSTTTTDTSTNNTVVNTGDIFVDFEITLIAKYNYALSGRPTTSANAISSTSHYDWNWSSTGNTTLLDANRYNTYINILSEQPAQYDITLTVTRKSDGAQGSRTKRIKTNSDGSFTLVNGNVTTSTPIPNPQPTPQFRITSISGSTIANVGDTKTYQAVPSGNQGSVTYKWAVNQDVQSSTSDRISVTFNNAGSNTISVVGTDSVSNQASAQKTVNVAQPTVSSNFTATTNGNFVSLASNSTLTSSATLEENTPVTFLASTFDNNYDYQWLAQNITTNSRITTFDNNSFDYNFPEGVGTYKITLSILGNNIETSTTEKYIAIKQATTLTPQFRITSISGSTIANVGDTKTYSAVPSGNQGSVTYKWAVNQDVQSSTSDRISVTFNNAGSNTISVVGTDSVSNQASAQKIINVAQSTVSSDFTATTNGNFVSLSYSDFALTPTLEENTSVTFLASTFDNNYDYQWQAQNTTTNSGITTFNNNSFDYNFPEGVGTYKITLSILGNDIETSTTEKYIAIKQASQPAQPEIGYGINNELSVCNAPVYTFTATAPNQINSVNWSTSNIAVIEEVGNSSTTQNPINYKFTKAGDYTITANIVTATGSNNITENISIEKDDLNINCPEANFTVSQPVQVCRAVTYDVDASTAITNDENDPLVSYKWTVVDSNDNPALSSNYTVTKNPAQPEQADISIKAVGSYKINLTVTTENGYSNTTSQAIDSIATLPEVGCPQQVGFEVFSLPDGQTFIFTVSPVNQNYTWLVNAKQRDFIKLSTGRYKYTITTQDKPFYSPYDEIFYYEVTPQANDTTLEPAKPKKLVLKQQNAIRLAIPRLAAQLVDDSLILSVLNRDEYPDIQIDIKQNNRNLANEEINAGEYRFAISDIADGNANIELSAEAIKVPLTKQNGVITVKPYASVITPTLDKTSVSAPYSIYVDGSNSYMPMQNDSINSYQWWLLPIIDPVNVPTCNDNVAKQTTGLEGDLTQARTNLTLTAQEGSYKICLTVTSKNGVSNSNGTGVIDVESYTQHQVDIQRYIGNLIASNLTPYNEKSELITFYGDVFVANQAKQTDSNDIINLNTEDKAVSVFMNIKISELLVNSFATFYNILQVIPPNWDDDIGIWYMQTPETYPFYTEWSLFDENDNVNFAGLKPAIEQIQLKQNNTIVLYNGNFEESAGDYNFYVILEQEKAPNDYDYYFSYPPLQLKVTNP